MRHSDDLFHRTQSELMVIDTFLFLFDPLNPSGFLHQVSCATDLAGLLHVLCCGIVLHWDLKACSGWQIRLIIALDAL